MPHPGLKASTSPYFDGKLAGIFFSHDLFVFLLN